MATYAKTATAQGAGRSRRHRFAVAAAGVLTALAIMAGFSSNASAAVRLSDGTVVSVDVGCWIDAGGTFMRYTTSSPSTGVWYRVFTKQYDLNWNLTDSGTTAWMQMQVGTNGLGAARMGTLNTPLHYYVFQFQFFKNSVYSLWYGSSPSTTDYYNWYGSHTDYGICRV